MAQQLHWPTQDQQQEARHYTNVVAGYHNVAGNPVYTISNL